MWVISTIGGSDASPTATAEPPGPGRGSYDNEAMTFAPGDEVHVAALGKGVVREVRNGGRYLVELKGRSIVAAQAQLTAVSPRKREASSDAHASSTNAPDGPTRSY